MKNARSIFRQMYSFAYLVNAAEGPWLFLGSIIFLPQKDVIAVFRSRWEFGLLISALVFYFAVQTVAVVALRTVPRLYPFDRLVELAQLHQLESERILLGVGLSVLDRVTNNQPLVGDALEDFAELRRDGKSTLSALAIVIHRSLF